MTAQLIKCPVCDGNVSSHADSCPHCGQAMKRKRRVSIPCPDCSAASIVKASKALAENSYIYYCHCTNLVNCGKEYSYILSFNKYTREYNRGNKKELQNDIFA